MKTRCPWAGDDPVMRAYHDGEWGVPLRDDRSLFEFLILEGAQAGLSWSTILKKREHYRRAFDDFDPDAMVSYDENRIQELLADGNIVRNRRKIESAVENARAFVALRETGISFSDFVWQFVEGRPVTNRWKQPGDVPAITPESALLSKELKAKGFSFVGPTICYAFMQAVGMVNDHLVTCFRHAEISG